MLLIFTSMQGCGLFSGAEDDFRVEYEVIGTASSVTIVYLTIDEETITIEGESIPWSHGFDAFKGQVLFLQAQNETDEGEVRVRILVNGSVFLEARNPDPFGTATASGNV